MISQVFVCSWGRLHSHNATGRQTLLRADPSRQTPTSRYGQPAVGTHPTGMHSCLIECSLFSLIYLFSLSRESSISAAQKRMVTWSRGGGWSGPGWEISTSPPGQDHHPHPLDRTTTPPWIGPPPPTPQEGKAIDLPTPIRALCSMHGRAVLRILLECILVSTKLMPHLNFLFCETLKKRPNLGPCLRNFWMALVQDRWHFTFCWSLPLIKPMNID